MNRLTEDDIEFDMIGIDPALANAFRRILIAEVKYLLSPVFMFMIPLIENTVFAFNSTSSKSLFRSL